MTATHEAVKTRHKETSHFPGSGTGCAALLGKQSVIASGCGDQYSGSGGYFNQCI